MKTVVMLEIPPCDICTHTFSHASPNPALYDGPIRGQSGTWAYACEAHAGYLECRATKLVKGGSL